MGSQRVSWTRLGDFHMYVPVSAHLAQRFQSSPEPCMFQHLLPSRWWITWSVNKLSHLCSHQVKGVWVASVSGLFWIVLLSTVMDKFLCQCAFSFRNTRNVSTPGIESLGQITPHVTFSFYITTTDVRTFQILHTLTFSYCLSLILITRVGVKQYLTAVSICISQWGMMLSLFPCTYQPILWRNVYSDQSSIFNSVASIFMIKN